MFGLVTQNDLDSLYMVIRAMQQRISALELQEFIASTVSHDGEPIRPLVEQAEKDYEAEHKAYILGRTMRLP